MPSPRTSSVSLRLHVLLALGMTGLALMLALAALLPQLITARFDHQEAQRARDDTQRVARALSTELEALGTYTLNWSAWDDSYRYVQHPSAAFEQTNLVPTSFESARLNLMLFFDRRGAVVSARAYDLAARRAVPSATLVAGVRRRYGALLQPRSLSDVRAGVVWLPSGAWLLAARPIVTSANTGPAVGTLVLGRQLTPALLSDLKRDAQLSLSVRPTSAGQADLPGAVQVRAVGEQRLEGRTVLRDLAGRPSLELVVGAARLDHANGLASARVILLWALAVVLLFTALTTLLVDRLVLGRLSRYRQQAQELLGETAARTRFAEPNSDELSDLAHALNRLLDQTDRDRQQLEHQANHDDLTGLFNRAHFKRDLARRLAAGQPVAVALIDLDTFKAINDTLGHEVGDEVLCGVAARLHASLPEASLLARLGGDEFVALFPDTGDVQVGRLTHGLLKSLHAPLPTSAGGLFVSASAGVAWWPGGQHEDPPPLLKHADLALYQAKAARGRVQLYQPEFSYEAERRSDLERGLRNALPGGELWLAYQSVVDLATGRAVACEALLRWDRPGHGAVSPAQFIPVAEERGLIQALGGWVLRAACEQAAAWQRAGHPLRVAVNVSAVQLGHEGFAEDVAAALRASALPPALLELEVTETAVTRDLPLALRQLAQVRALGVAVALDDFGTGYASLELLRELPLDKLKLDRSFVQGAEHSPRRQVIVAAVVRMARELGLQVVAEGVETLEQRDLLRGLGCPLAQGYLYARPVPAVDLWPLNLADAR